MTRYEKLAITLPSRAAEHVRRAVKSGRAASVSAYIASAVEARFEQESLQDLLDEMLAETGGPLTPAEKAWADRMLGKRRSRNPRRR